MINTLDRIDEAQYRALILSYVTGRDVRQASIDAGVDQAVSRRIIEEGELPPLVSHEHALEIKGEYGFVTPLIPENPHLQLGLDGLTYTRSDESVQKISGISDEMDKAFRSLNKAAGEGVHVVILGESGTGKQLFSEAIHYGSLRRTNPYIDRNCAALAEGVIESELFGHEKGSFTGAVGEREGAFRLGNKGTVFLDEISELPTTVQAKLLKAIENGHIYPVGHDLKDPIRVDTKIIAATSKDLVELTRTGKFREDLLQRLCGWVIYIPTLRERGNDECVFLAAGFLEEYNRQKGKEKILGPDAKDSIRRYRWPGNVRQLRNTVVGAAISSGNRDEISKGDIYEKLSFWDSLTKTGAPVTPNPQSTSVAVDLDQGQPSLFVEELKNTSNIHKTLDKLERFAIIERLTECDGHLGLVSESLGLSRKGLDAKLKRYGIDAAEFKRPKRIRR